MTRTLMLASAAAGALLAQVVAADAAPFDWSGFYAGVHGGILTGDVSLHEDGFSLGGNIQGTVVGGLVGYNFPTTPLAPIRFGLEGDFGWANVTGHGSNIICADVVDGCVDYLYDLKWDAHLRLIAGVPMGNITPFIGAGLAIADLNISEVPFQFEGGIYTGASLGAGLNVNLGPNLILRGEILADFYGRKQYDDFSVDLMTQTGRAALIWRLP